VRSAATDAGWHMMNSNWPASCLLHEHKDPSPLGELILDTIKWTFMNKQAA
jgi:hypothetical protein